MKNTRTIDDALIENFLGARKKFLSHSVRNSDVIEKHRELEREMDAAEKEIKEAARGFSEPGKTVTLVDLALIKVTVTGPMSSPPYNITRAREVWPKALVERVSIIDAGMVKELIKLGEVPGELAAKAEGIRAVLVPTVKVTCT